MLAGRRVGQPSMKKIEWVEPEGCRHESREAPGTRVWRVMMMTLRILFLSCLISGMSALLIGCLLQNSTFETGALQGFGLALLSGLSMVIGFVIPPGGSVGPASVTVDERGIRAGDAVFEWRDCLGFQFDDEKGTLEIYRKQGPLMSVFLPEGEKRQEILSRLYQHLSNRRLDHDPFAGGRRDNFPWWFGLGLCAIVTICALGAGVLAALWLPFTAESDTTVDFLIWIGGPAALGGLLVGEFVRYRWHLTPGLRKVWGFGGGMLWVLVAGTSFAASLTSTRGDAPLRDRVAAGVCRNDGDWLSCNQPCRTLRGALMSRREELREKFRTERSRSEPSG